MRRASRGSITFRIQIERSTVRVGIAVAPSGGGKILYALMSGSKDGVRKRLRRASPSQMASTELGKEATRLSNIPAFNRILASRESLVGPLRRTIEQSGRAGFATSLLGRRRPVPELRARNRQTRGFGERVAVNFVMQGSNADIIKVAMVAIHRRLREEGRGARLVLQVHDELLLEAPDAETSVVKELVREEMCSAYPLDPPLAVDVGAGDSWADAKS